MADIINLNLDVISSFNSDTKNVLNNYIKTIKTGYESSYLTQCSDSSVSIMSSKLGEKYNKLYLGYTNTQKWIEDFVNSAMGVESSLVNENVNGLITESNISSYISSNMKQLNNANLDINQFIFSSAAVNAISFAASSVETWTSNFFDDPLAVFTKTASAVGDKVQNACGDIYNSWPWFFDTIGSIATVLTKVGCTITTFAVSLVEGVVKLGEGLIDLCAIIGTAVSTIGTGLIDGCQAVWGLATGNEWDSVTLSMWKNTMSFVATDYTSGWFDSFYNTMPGSFLKNNAYGFDVTRTIGSGIGYVAGIIAISILTAGIGGAAIGGTAGAGTGVSAAATTVAGSAATTGIPAWLVSGAAGFGKGAEKSWSEGANLVQGLGYASLNSIWEGFQFWVGGKINGLNIVSKLPSSSLFNAIKNSGTLTQIVNSLSHVTLDASTSFGETTVVDPIMGQIYKPEGEQLEKALNAINYDENGNQISNLSWEDLTVSQKLYAIFEANGGWTNVMTQTITGGIVSFLTEVPDIGKSILRDIKKTNAEVALPFLGFNSQKNFEKLLDEKGKISDLRPLLSNMSPDKYLQKNIDVDKLIRIYKSCNGDPLAMCKKLQDSGSSMIDIIASMDFYARTQSNLSYTRSADMAVRNFLVINGYSFENASKIMSCSLQTRNQIRGFIKMNFDPNTGKPINGLEIYIQNNINWNNQAYSINSILEFYNKLPQSLRESVHKFYIYDSFNPDDFFWEWKYRMKNFVSAATGGEGVINIYASKEVNYGTIIHESAHNYDNIIGGNQKFSLSDIWQKAMSDDRSLTGSIGCSDYARASRSPLEDFAEAVREYIIGDNELNNYPSRLNVLKQMFGPTSQQVEKDLDIVIDILANKYGGRDRAMKIINDYIVSGDIQMITRDGNARNIISQYSVDTVRESYLDITDNLGTVVQTVSKINDDYNNVYNILLDKYHDQKSVETVILNYLTTGNLKLITRDGNARDILAKYSIEDLKTLLNFK